MNTLLEPPADSLVNRLNTGYVTFSVFTAIVQSITPQKACPNNRVLII